MKRLTVELREQWEDMMRNSTTTDQPYCVGKDNVGMFTCHGNRLDSISDLIKKLEELLQY